MKVQELFESSKIFKQGDSVTYKQQDAKILKVHPDGQIEIGILAIKPKAGGPHIASVVTTDKKSLQLKEAVKGNWRISNLMGVVKTFKDEDSPEAKAWMRNRDTSVNANRDIDRELDREDRERARELKRQEAEDRRIAAAKKKAKAEAMKQIPSKIDDAIAYAMDGGEPIDSIGRWMDRTGIDMDDIDAVANKQYKTKGGLYGVIAMHWDDMQADRMHDAKIDVDRIKKAIEKNGPPTPKKYGHAFSEIDNDFVEVDKDGNIIPADNPWKPM